MPISPNMSLTIPTVGQTEAPDWGLDLNNALTTIDQHDHSPGSGVQITPEGINITTDLDFNETNLLSVRSVRFEPQDAVLVGVNDLGCIYVVDEDLYYNDGSGNDIRLTQNGAVAGTPGSIANLAAPASATYVSGDAAFVWQSDIDTPAVMDGGPVIVRELVMNGEGVTLSAPTGLAASYTTTLPAAPPANPGALVMDSSGNVTASPGTMVPTGMVLPFAGTSVPAGYLECDGSAVSRTTYSALFAVIGTTWGVGDGSTTFNIPNMERRTAIGRNGTATDGPANTVGSTGGAQTVTLTVAQMPTHTHTVTDPGHTHLGQVGGTGADNFAGTAAYGASGGTGYGYTQLHTTNSTGISLANNGSGSAHPNMPPSAVFIMAIKT